MAEDTIDSGAGSAGSGNKLVTILTVANFLLTGGMGAILFLSYQKEKSSPAVGDIAMTAPEAAAKPAADAGAEGGGEAAAKDGAASSKEATTAVADYGKMVTLEQFTVNLATPGTMTPQYVRVNISLEVPSPDSEHEVTQKMPQVRNAIIDLFNSKRPADLATAEGREYLKEEIRNALNSFMRSGKVRGVFFTNFAVSS